ncbi:MAG: thioredoxin domain-containing protein [Limnochordales bacterium]
MTGEATRKANRLIHETSPYLRQHAHNPVDWYPWGEEALARARRENKPILLSIGYSACHWCHVMERESFADPDIAAVMNEHFVNIKVDREERPDLDHTYQLAAQLLSGQGGWPLTVVLTPDLRPFFAGTYFPPDDRYGRPGFKRVLRTLHRVYTEDPDGVAEVAAQLAEALRKANRLGTSGGEGVPSHHWVEQGVQRLLAEADHANGGFGRAPKFPSVSSLQLVQRWGHLTGDAAALAFVDLTLERMAAGGIYDQLGGGFHRYSVDAHWLVPHFEKMLYDNGLLALLYLEGWQRTGRALYERIVRETLDYILREMADPAGGFYTSQDADSEGEEGRFFVWTPQEVREALGEPAASRFCLAYGVGAGGNFHDGKSVLHVALSPAELARQWGMDVDAVEAELAAARARLWAVRERRVKPHRDEKVLVGWNGLVITALARAGAALGVPAYLAAARRAVAFVQQRLMTPEGDLLHSFKEWPAPVPGFLDDYAFFVAALIDLYEATLEPDFLAEAARLAGRMLALFWDDEEGGFFLTPAGLATPLGRPKELWDESVPAGNGAAAMTLLRLFFLTGDDGWRIRAEKLLAAFASPMARNPWGTASLLTALDQYHRGPKEIAFTGPVFSREGQALLQRVHRLYIPHRVLSGFDPARAAARPPLLQDREPVEGRLTVYVCEDFACSPPVTRWEDLEPLLRAPGPR